MSAAAAVRLGAIGSLLLAIATTACGDDDVIAATGTIEVDQSDVAPMVPARVVRLTVEEGDRVRRGDTLAVLSQATLPADIEQRQARVAAAAAALAELERGPRQPEIERAEAELRSAEAEAERAARDLERLTALETSGAISRSDLDLAATAARSAAARRDALTESLRLLRQGTRRERLEAARAEVASARAALAAARATAAELVLTAPVDGVVLGRHSEPGEVLPAGAPAVTVGQLAEPWVRVYVGPGVVPRLRIGQPVSATLDGFPERAFEGRIIAIADRAEFTPRVALTEEERSDLLFGVKVALRDSSGMLKPGLPATVRFDPETMATWQ